MFRKLLGNYNLWIQLCFIGAALYLSHPTLFKITRLITDTTMDAFLFTWTFWWADSSLMNWHNPFVTNQIFYPYEVNLSLATLSLPYGIVGIPLIHIFGTYPGITIAYNLVVFASFYLAAFFFYKAAKTFQVSTKAALLGAIIYTATPIHYEHLPRLHLLCIEMIPLAIWLLRITISEIGKSKGRIWAVCFGLSMSLTVYLSQTYAIQLAILCPLFILFSIWEDPTRLRSREFYLRLTIALIACVVSASPYLINLADILVKNHPTTTDPLFPDIFRFILPGSNRPFYSWFPLKLNQPNHNFPGYLIYVLAFISFWMLIKRKRYKVFFLLIVLVFIGATFALGRDVNVSGKYIQVFTPMDIAEIILPPLRLDRAPDRYFLICVFGLVLAISIGMDFILEKLSAEKWKIAITVGIMLMTLIELRPLRLGYTKPKEIFPRYINELGQLNPGFENAFLGMPFDEYTNKHYFFIQTLTGWATLDADYPRMAKEFSLRAIKEAGLWETMKKPETISNEKFPSFCKELRNVLLKNNVRVIIIPDNTTFGSENPEGIQLNYSHILAKRCANIAVNSGTSRLKLFLPTNAYFFWEDKDMEQKIRTYLKDSAAEYEIEN